MSKFKKGDLTFWVSRTGHKFWGIVSCLNRSKKNPQVYTVSDNHASWYDLELVVPATEAEIIEYNQQAWRHSEEHTLNAISIARKYLNV